MGETQQDPLCSHTGAYAVSSLFSLQKSSFHGYVTGYAALVQREWSTMICHNTLPADSNNLHSMALLPDVHQALVL